MFNMKVYRVLELLMCGILGVASIASFAQQHKNRVLIIVTSADKFSDGKPTGMWLEEYAVPYQMMLKQGYELTVVSPKGGESPVDPRSAAKGDQEMQWSDALKARKSTVKLTDRINTEDFDAVFIPGGHGPLFDLASDKLSIRLISGFARSGKPVASVCHGPAALVGVTLTNGNPLVKGKNITAFSDAEEKAADPNVVVPFSVQQRLTELGGKYTQGPNFGEYAVQDGTLIIGQNPGSSAKVAQLLIDLLETGRK
jgi:putative intracellular protease/amidase